nr:terminal uridylyltransferase 7-like [Salvelinus alpinus]
MEESGGRPRYPKQEGRERGPVADEAEIWRNQDAGRGYSPKPKRGGHGGLHHASSKKGAMEPQSSYPAGGFKEGHSPSQREDFQRARYPESQQAEGREENWRKHPSQRWRRTSQGEDMEQRRDNVDNTLHSGGRNRRNHNWRRGLGEEDHGPVVDESALSAKELLGLKQAEDKIGREKIFRLKKRSHSNPSAVYTALCVRYCWTLSLKLTDTSRQVAQEKPRSVVRRSADGDCAPRRSRCSVGMAWRAWSEREG